MNTKVNARGNKRTVKQIILQLDIAIGINIVIWLRVKLTYVRTVAPVYLHDVYLHNLGPISYLHNVNVHMHQSWP